MTKYMLIGIPLAVYALIVFMSYGQIEGSASLDAAVLGVWGELMGNVGIAAFTVVAMMAMIVLVSVVGLHVSVFGSSIKISDASVHALITTIPLVVLYSLLFTMALPPMSAFPLGIGVGLNGFLSLMFMIGLMSMIAYG